MTPAARLATITAAALILAAIALSLWRGNPGPLIILGAFAYLITR